MCDLFFDDANDVLRGSENREIRFTSCLQMTPSTPKPLVSGVCFSFNQYLEKSVLKSALRV